MSNQVPYTDNLAIPASRRVNCEFCNTVIDNNAPGTYQHMEGWGLVRKKGSVGSTLLERHYRWACRVCIEALQSGIPIGQGKLF